jgi:alpha-beta hydrolase superfamily lysophospholipase
MPVPITRWEVPRPRALVHVVHGMTEYGRRYARFAAALNGAGLTVWAHDHRGHGDHLATDGTHRPGDFGDDGWEGLVGDTQHVSRMLQESSPGTPLLLFAHSMGSFVAQAVITRSGGEYTGVVLCGSNGPPGRLEAAALVLARLEVTLRGATTPSRWVHDSVFRRYNASFKPTRTPSDWLSRDPAEVDAYVADPRCGFALTTRAWRDFLTGKAGLGDAAVLRRIPASLPVHLIAGDRDPVGEDGGGVRRLRDTYRQAGLTRVSLQLYPGARHELVNETNRDEVTRDVIAWIDDVIARPTVRPGP